MEFGNFGWELYVDNVRVGAINKDLSWVEVLNLNKLVSIKVGLGDSGIIRIFIKKNGNGSSSF